MSDININFKDGTISVDSYSCFCPLIPKDKTSDRISLHIIDGIATLYTVGKYTILDDYSFIEEWVNYNQQLLFEDKALAIQSVKEDKENYAAMEANAALGELLKTMEKPVITPLPEGIEYHNGGIIDNTQGGDL